MTPTALTLVTIVAEKVLEAKLERLLLGAGASGFTATDARGQGSRHTGSSTFEGQNVRIETVVSAEVARRIVDQIADLYFPHYGVIAFTSEVAVVRGEKYVGT
ncbi:MAG: P-II family nitrogen regulator [Acidimicrobiia bacterium]